MSHFPSTPNLEFLGLFRKFPERGILPLLEYDDAVLRNEGELIAACVSTLNQCHYCFFAHRDHAGARGVPADLLGDLRFDRDRPGPA